MKSNISRRTFLKLTGGTAIAVVGLGNHLPMAAGASGTANEDISPTDHLRLGSVESKSRHQLQASGKGVPTGEEQRLAP